MVMSNFIDESERHAELYGDYTERQKYVLEIARKITNERRSDREIQDSLLKHGITCPEIHWLKRTGHCLPLYM